MVPTKRPMMVTALVKVQVSAYIRLMVGLVWLSKRSLVTTFPPPIAQNELQSRKHQEKLTYVDKSKMNLSDNIFFTLLKEYTKHINVNDCYVCAYLPVSVQESMTSNPIPLT